MANTSPTVDSVPVLDDILTRAKAEKIRIYQAGAVSRSLKGEELTDMDALKKPAHAASLTTVFHSGMHPSCTMPWKRQRN